VTRPSGTGSNVSRETLGLGLSGEQQEVLGRYRDILATAGVERGMIGPREGDRLWSRHLLNCAVVATPEANLIPESSSVADVGSGAGLPGIVWAILRPDISMILVEPLLRRTRFLDEIVGELGLSGRVVVRRSRAQDLAPDLRVDVTTARAVAPLERLLPMLAPLTRSGGLTLALKGDKAETELASSTNLAASLGYVDTSVRLCGEGIVNPPTRVIRLLRQST
jgi:16S rRNA (guanine527-N7)-methyltransferase